MQDLNSSGLSPLGLNNLCAQTEHGLLLGDRRPGMSVCGFLLPFYSLSFVILKKSYPVEWAFLFLFIAYSSITQPPWLDHCYPVRFISSRVPSIILGTSEGISPAFSSFAAFYSPVGMSDFSKAM